MDIDTINEWIEYYLPAIPNIEFGDATGGNCVSLRATKESSIGDIILELQYRLYSRMQLKHMTNIKMIISPLTIFLSPHNQCEILMVNLKYMIIE